MSNFIEKCLHGEALLEEIDDFVDKWHEGESNLPLHKFLGMTEQEYSLWVVDPDVLSFVVMAHQQNCNVADLLNKVATLPIAARSDGPDKAKKLMNWLKHEGLWK